MSTSKSGVPLPLQFTTADGVEVRLDSSHTLYFWEGFVDQGVASYTEEGYRAIMEGLRARVRRLLDQDLPVLQIPLFDRHTSGYPRWLVVYEFSSYYEGGQPNKLVVTELKTELSDFMNEKIINSIVSKLNWWDLSETCPPAEDYDHFGEG